VPKPSRSLDRRINEAIEGDEKRRKEMYKTIIKFTGIITLAAAIITSAVSAQNKIDGGGLAPAGYYTGVETAQGNCDEPSGMCYGNTFVLNSSGEWETHHLSVSLDYSLGNSIVRNQYAISGGTWSLVIYRDNAYAGTLYGTISGGDVLLTTLSSGDAVKQTQLNLLSTGGLGALTGKKYAGIAGVYQAETNVRSGETSGAAVFAF
jgi:hypothetical protein